MNSLLKRSLVISAVSAVVIAVVLTRCSCKGDVESSIQEENKVKNAEVALLINPLSSKFDVPYSEFAVTAGSDTTLTYISGTKIYIPACALVDKDGVPAIGSVKIYYREVSDHAGIITTGIPMLVKQGAQDFLETTGMMEIKAEQGGKELAIKNGCPIKFDMVNTKEGKDVNLYYLDKDQRKWTTVKSDLKANVLNKFKIKPGKVNSSPPDYEKMAKEAAYFVPVKPKVANSSRFGFHFKIDLSKYPEVNVYDGIIWEYAGKGGSDDPKNNSWVEKAVWKEMFLDKTTTKGVFKLRLLSNSRSFETIVRPVFDKEDMEYALDVFNYRYDMYRKFTDKKKEEYRKWVKEQERLKQVTATTSFITRAFEINKFGIWNCDILQKVENPGTVVLNIKPFRSEQKIEKVYMVDQSKVSVIYYTPAENIISEFKYEKGKDYKILILDSDSRLHKMTMADCLNNAAKGQPLTLKSEGIQINDMKELKAIL